MSTDIRLLRSWMAELAATEQFVRANLATVLGADAVRRVEADAVAVADDLLTRAGFDPDDVAFAATAWWSPPPLPAGEPRAAEEHTDELLDAAVSTPPVHLEAEADSELDIEPLVGDDLGLELGGEPIGDGWVTYEEVAEEKPTDEVPAEVADAWVQYEDEQPTNPGIAAGPKTVSLSAGEAVPPDRTPTQRPASEPARSAAASYMTHDDEGDVSVHDEEEEITGIFDRRAANAGQLQKGPPSPPLEAMAEPFQPDADSAVTLDTEIADDNSPTPIPDRAPRHPGLDARAGEATNRAAQEVEEFELVVDDLEPVGPTTEDETDNASDAEVVAPPPRATASAPPASKDRGGRGGVRAPTPPGAPARVEPGARGGARAAVPTARATAGLYGGAAVPTIRDSGDRAAAQAARPKAAAIQINTQAGSSKVLGLEEEEEPLEIGSAEDYGEEEPDVEPASGGGFRVDLQEYEEVEVEPEPEPEPEPVAAQPAFVPPVALGPSAGEIEDMLSRARAAEEGGLLDEGISLYADVLDADPDNIDARVGRGRLYLDRGDFARAMSDFMVAEEIGPQHPEPQIAIGDLHFARKDYRKAIEYFDLALSLAPKSAKAYCRRGISHYWRKAYPQALTDLTTAQKIDPETPNIGTYITMVKKKMKK